MRREYEALSKLVGKNFAVLDDGMGVYLTPKGEVRDIDGRLLLPGTEGRAALFEKNLEGGNDASDSGGVSSWNDLTDKPFGESVEKTVKIPEQTVTTDQYRRSVLSSQKYKSFTVGQEFCVNYNGTKYDLAVVNGSDGMSYNALGLGNPYVFTLNSEWNEDNGLPFFIYSPPREDGVSAYMLATREPDTSATVEVYTEEKTITPIPAEYMLGRTLTENDHYLPLAFGEEGKIVPVDIFPSLLPPVIVKYNENYHLGSSFEYFMSAIENGIFPVLNNDDDGTIYPCTKKKYMDNNSALLLHFETITIKLELATGNVTEYEK